MSDDSYNALDGPTSKHAQSAVQRIRVAGQVAGRSPLHVGGPVLNPAATRVPVRRTVFLFMGGSGVGKTFAVDFLAGRVPGSVYRLAKLSSRPHRPSDEQNAGMVVGVPPGALRVLSRLGHLYTYEYGGFAYALSRPELRHAKCSNITTVVGSTAVIHAIRQDFARDRVVAVYLTAPNDVIVTRLHAAGCSTEEVRTRLARSDEIASQYEADPGVFDHVITNDGSREAFERHVVDVFLAYNTAVAMPFQATAA